MIEWTPRKHDESDKLKNKTIKEVVWLIASHYQGGAPLLRIVFTDDSFFDIDHSGDDASGLIAEGYDPSLKHTPNLPIKK